MANFRKFTTLFSQGNQFGCGLVLLLSSWLRVEYKVYPPHGRKQTIMRKQEIQKADICFTVLVDCDTISSISRFKQDTLILT